MEGRQKMKRYGVRMLAFLVIFVLTACGAEGSGPEQETEEKEEKMIDVTFAGGEAEAYRSYLEERESVGDLYFACLNLEGNDSAVLALTHEKHGVDVGEETITANHLVLNNFIQGEVVQVAGSSMDTYSENTVFSYGEGKLWVPVYGGISFYTVSGSRITGEVYVTEAGVSTKYSVTGKKRTEPETVPSETVSEMVKGKEQTLPVRFYPNTEKNRDRVFASEK